MSSPREVVDRVGGRFPLPDDAFERLAHRRDRKHRNQRIGAGALVLLLMLVAAGAFARALMIEGFPADGTRLPTPPPTEEPAPIVSIDWERVPGVTVEGDAIVDIRTGEITPLPAGITSVLKRGGYAVAPGGDALLFETHGRGSKGNQIFVANVDGTNVRQLTDAPGGATAGSWSPDGTKIVALLGGREGSDPRPDVDLALVDVATAETTTLASGPEGDFNEPHFSADAQRVLFGRFTKPEGSDTFGIPVGGGDATLVFEERWNAIFSPDGRTIVYDASVSVGDTGGLEQWLADADGSHPRPLVPNDEPFSFFPSWSPDGTRIVYLKWPHGADPRVAVVDVANGTPTFSVLTHEPGVGVWLDDNTLLVDVNAF
jgi:Tol biopolymer transport system component